MCLRGFWKAEFPEEAVHDLVVVRDEHRMLCSAFSGELQVRPFSATREQVLGKNAVASPLAKLPCTADELGHIWNELLFGHTGVKCMQGVRSVGIDGRRRM